MANPMKTKRVKKIEPPSKTNVWVERYLTDDEGHIVAVDLHDERFGEAIFCEPTDRHYHGKYNTPITPLRKK